MDPSSTSLFVTLAAEVSERPGFATTLEAIWRRDQLQATTMLDIVV